MPPAALGRDTEVSVLPLPHLQACVLSRVRVLLLQPAAQRQSAAPRAPQQQQQHAQLCPATQHPDPLSASTPAPENFRIPEIIPSRVLPF